jgi:uncharacterized 2Fe-2S/4Fe-4S cluster protein (DUF4445 family)
MCGRSNWRKAALFTAARTLLKRSGLQSPDKIILAGGFGSYIDQEKGHADSG